MSSDSPKARVNYTELAAITLRDNDRDLYLCSLFAPENRRAALQALYAFNAEIVRASQASSEAAIGHMRLKWWYDALDDIFANNPPHHPVAQALADASSYKLGQGVEQAALTAVIEAHADDLATEPDFGAEAQTARAKALWGPITAQATALSGAPSKHGDALAIAWGLTMTLRHAPVAPESVQALHDAARTNVETAVGHLSMVLADIYLRRIERANFDLSDPIARRKDPGALALPKLWWAARLRKAR